MPNLDCFKKVLNINKLNASETIFIDDSKQHIEGALKCGIKGYLFPQNYTILMRIWPKLESFLFFRNQLSFSLGDQKKRFWHFENFFQKKRFQNSLFPSSKILELKKRKD